MITRDAATLATDFQYLKRLLKPSQDAVGIIQPTFERMLDYDILLSRGRFEFSLEIQNGILMPFLRFVHYDHCFHDARAYRKRIEILDHLTSFWCRQRIRKLFFDFVYEFLNLRLPVAIGVESHPLKNLVVKLYLNFFEIRNHNALLADALIRYFLKRLSFPSDLVARHAVLLGLSLPRTNRDIHFKIYNVYPKKKILHFVTSSSCRLSAEEVKNLKWVNRFNRLDYFDIMEKGNFRGSISQKVEIHPLWPSFPFKTFLARTKSSELAPPLTDFFKKIDGRVETIGIEKKRMVLYVAPASEFQDNDQLQ